MTAVEILRRGTEPGPSDPVQGPDRPWPGLPPGGPQAVPSMIAFAALSRTQPGGGEDMSVPDTGGSPKALRTPRVSLRVGRPPRFSRGARVRRGCRVALVVGYGAVVAALATLVLAGVVRKLNLGAPLNDAQWLVALVAVIGLVSQLVAPRRPKAARARLKTSRPRVPATSSAGDADADGQGETRSEGAGANSARSLGRAVRRLLCPLPSGHRGTGLAAAASPGGG